MKPMRPMNPRAEVADAREKLRDARDALAAAERDGLPDIRLRIMRGDVARAEQALGFAETFAARRA